MFAIITQRLVVQLLFQTMTAVFRVSDYFGGRGPASLKCQKLEAVSVVTKLYEVRAKPKAEDAQLRTGSDTVSPG